MKAVRSNFGSCGLGYSRLGLLVSISTVGRGGGDLLEKERAGDKVGLAEDEVLAVADDAVVGESADAVEVGEAGRGGASERTRSIASSPFPVATSGLETAASASGLSGMTSASEPDRPNSAVCTTGLANRASSSAGDPSASDSVPILSATTALCSVPVALRGRGVRCDCFTCWMSGYRPSHAGGKTRADVAAASVNPVM